MTSEQKPTAPEQYDIVPESEPFEEGFNKRTIIAAFFVGLVMMPGSIYLGLVTGQSLAGGAEWVTIILFIEIAKRSFVRLKTQEIIILYWMASGLAAAAAGIALFGGPFGQFIWNQYFLQSPMAENVREYIPDWIVPSIHSEAIVKRSFLHRDMLKPLGLILFVTVGTRICSISLGYVLFRVTSDVEHLPFPMAPVQAGGVTALAETSGKREGWRWRVFSTGTFIGALFGMVYIVVPTISSILLTRPVTLLPIPFIDFTPSIKSYLPATILGLNTNLVMFFMGFVLPFWSVVGTFIGAMLVTFIANPMLYRMGVLHTWQPGMATIPTQIADTIDFWLSFNIGPAFWIAIIGITFVVRAFMKGRSQDTAFTTETGEVIQRRVRTDRGDCRLIWPILLWIGSTTAFVALVHILVPEFPWWISAMFGFIWSPLMSYITARMIGLTGSPQGVGIPYLREATFYMTGYKGAAIWFAPIPMFNYGGTVNAFKQLELTHCKFGSYIKMIGLSTTVVLFCSAFYWQMIWKMGEIPSASYPFVQKMWPLYATMQSIWVNSTVPRRLSLFSFEEPAEGKWVADGLEAEVVKKYGVRETQNSLELKLPAGRRSGQVTFTGFTPEWTVLSSGKKEPVRDFEFYVRNPRKEKVKLKVLVRSLGAAEGAGGKAEVREASQEVELLPGLNAVTFVAHASMTDAKTQAAYRRKLDKIKSNYFRQLPPREQNAKVRYFEWVRDGKGELNLNNVQSITLTLEGRGEKGETVYVDCLSLLADPEIFILGIIRFPYIALGFGIAALVYAILKTLGAPALLFYGLIAGTYTWPHNIIPIFFGAMVGRYIIMPRFGQQKWRTYAPILLAGYTCGASLIGMTSIAVVLIVKSISPIVF